MCIRDSSRADYTAAFRALSDLPEQVEPLKVAFYLPIDAELEQRWSVWLERWHRQTSADAKATMRSANPPDHLARMARGAGL